MDIIKRTRAVSVNKTYKSRKSILLITVTGIVNENVFKVKIFKCCVLSCAKQSHTMVRARHLKVRDRMSASVECTLKRIGISCVIRPDAVAEITV